MTRRTKGSIFWTLLGLIWIVGFIVGESNGLLHSDGLTLSRFVYEISAAWTPIVAIFGLTVGVLAQHFWGTLKAGWENELHRLDVRLRVIGLVIGWLLVVFLTGGGGAVFLAMVPIGMLVTRLWWRWDPNDPGDQRG
jgi:hypothetical protein